MWHLSSVWVNWNVSSSPVQTVAKSCHITWLVPKYLDTLTFVNISQHSGILWGLLVLCAPNKKTPQHLPIYRHTYRPASKKRMHQSLEHVLSFLPCLPPPRNSIPHRCPPPRVSSHPHHKAPLTHWPPPLTLNYRMQGLLLWLGVGWEGSTAPLRGCWG